MRIILSPAKKMKIDTDTLSPLGLPVYMRETEEILAWLKSNSPDQLKKLWKCNDKIAEQNIDRINHMDLFYGLTPAILSYEGIAYQYMAPGVFENEQYDYIQKHLRILSAFYGILKPMDGITPYRLEMQAKATIGTSKDLYDFWKKKIYDEALDDSRIIINLASKEYSRCVEKYLTSEDIYITITFCEKAGGGKSGDAEAGSERTDSAKSNPKLVTKGTYAKMARGEMVRYMAENKIEKPEEIKQFNRLGYVFREDLSSETEYVFERVK